MRAHDPRRAALAAANRRAFERNREARPSALVAWIAAAVAVSAIGGLAVFFWVQL